MSFSIEILSRDHDRSSFCCGTSALDIYFRERVTQDIKRRVTSCFVAVDQSGHVAGFYTLAATGLPLAELPAEIAARLPRYPLLPAALIGRLAVDQRFQKLGLGASLVVDALARLMRADAAYYALIVEAKDEQATQFYQHLGFQQFESKARQLFLPIAEAARILSK